MKSIKRWFIVVILLVNVTVLSGCQIFMLPVYIVGGTVVILGKLLPIAVRLMPLALLLVQVEDENSSGTMVVKADIPGMVESSQAVCADGVNAYQDGFMVIESVMRKSDGGTRKKLLIFAYDTFLPADVVAQEIQNRLPAGRVVKIDSHVVDGASFWNQKYRFFSLLDTLKEQGISFHAVGMLQPSTELINNDQGRS
ncbi:MAG: hypothetical protein C4541_11105 [Candidatus Auribacter fodinae]|jgi:hypothetical protein|uniref:Uncharacterized protein n=1 Tax=Candidatus Auribacter fodinae TaxID=2093366 RepID=A0A3A4R2I6_9BACT|nr:MAG: hypothetical protein C4541_11105 [Candidatus Auribacter fodinae]